MSIEEGILISTESLEEWAGRTLTSEDLVRLAEAIAESEIPAVIKRLAARPPCPICGQRHIWRVPGDGHAPDEQEKHGP